MAATAEERELQKQQQELADAERQAEQAAAAAATEAEKQGLSDDEVNARVEKARQEEKDKLYPQIQELKAGIKELQDHIRAERDEKDRMKREAEEEAERRRVAKLSENEKQTELLKKLEEQLREQNDERERFRKELEQRDQKDRLTRYRESQIKLAGDEILPELVSGNSEEEIDRSIEIAKARYKELEDRFKQRSGAQVKNNLRTTNPGTEALEEEELEKSLTDYDEDRYLKDPAYREQIKAELEGAYKRALGRA